MDPHPLANLFKRSNYDEPIASEFSSLDYLYEVLLEIYESENCDEVLNEGIYKVIHDSSLNEKHDCNDVIINSINVNYANNMENPKLGDTILLCPLLIAMIMIGSLEKISKWMRIHSNKLYQVNMQASRRHMAT